MKIKRGLIFGIIFTILIVGALFLQSYNLVSAQEVSYCAERTKSGNWCQNVPLSQVDQNYRSVPTSCESTSYCKSGTCVDTSEGRCLESTPKRVCESSEGEQSGVWYDRQKENIPQCQLGCCLMGDQASFVTQTRCQTLSSMYGLGINFRTDIKSETACIAAATPEAKGACVYETQQGRTCDFITKSECQSRQQQNPSVEFHQGLLCSNPDLGADCGKTRQTTCLEGKDEVYFVDSCGNRGNVYNAEKVDDTEYWSEIQAPECTVGADGAENCGACDYFAGTTCSPESEANTNANVGSNVCRSLDCEWQDVSGETRSYEHGETWCANSGGEIGENTGVTGSEISNINKEGNRPGSRDFRLVCYNGEVTVEPCADFRQEVCVESEVNDFKSAACRANRWQDCTSQRSQDACENSDQRDCVWTRGVSLLRDDDAGERLVYDPQQDRLVQKSGEDDNREGAACIPKHSPGFDFWNENTDAAGICEIANTRCFVQYEDRSISERTGFKVVKSQRDGVIGKLGEFFGLPKQEAEDIVCLNDDGEIVDDWETEIKNSCLALGDCGISANWIGEEGDFDSDDLFTVVGNLSEIEENEES